MCAARMETMYLKPSQHLAGVQKEKSTRKGGNGKDVAYLILDRSEKIVLLTQRLAAVAAFINTCLVDPQEPWTRVNTVGMWEILNQTEGRVGGWHKGRWRCQRIELEQATFLFEEARQQHAEAAVVGMPACYQVR